MPTGRTHGHGDTMAERTGSRFTPGTPGAPSFRQADSGRTPARTTLLQSLHPEPAFNARPLAASAPCTPTRTRNSVPTPRTTPTPLAPSAPCTPTRTRTDVPTPRTIPRAGGESFTELRACLQQHRADQSGATPEPTTQPRKRPRGGTHGDAHRNFARLVESDRSSDECDEETQEDRDFIDDTGDNGQGDGDWGGELSRCGLW